MFLLVGLKESPQVNPKDTTLKGRPGGLKEPIHYHPKELPRESNKNYQSCNRNMSPPLTNFQTNTTTSTTTSSSSMSNQQSIVSVPHQQQHYSSHQIPYGATPLHPQMYPSATVPLISHFPMHPGFMNPPGQPMISSLYGQHSDRSDISSRDMQNDHQSNSSSQHQMNTGRGGRRGRSRGGHNNMNRRDYPMRQNNQQQQQNQSGVASNEYGQPLMDQSQVMNSGPFQPYYFQLPYGYGAPNQGAQLTALPTSGTAANAQNLTGQPLFAIQHPFIYQYGSPYGPIMYNVMPQGHPMAHQQDMSDNENNQNQESGGTTPTTVIQSMPWPHHLAYQEPPPMFQHSPHLGGGEVELEYQVAPEEYHLQMMNQSNNYQIIATDQHGTPLVNEISVQTDDMPEDYVDVGSVENETIEELYQQDVVADNSNDTEVLVEKTRDLMIQTTLQEVSPIHMLQPASEDMGSKRIVPNSVETMSSTLSPVAPKVAAVVIVENAAPKVTENKMIVKNAERQPAWGGAAVVPNPAAQGSVKKQTASVSVSAIPNKDVMHLPSPVNDSIATTNDRVDADVISNVAPASGKENVSQNQTSFSSITASKLTVSSPTFVDSKKTENKQNEIQPLQKQQQMALSERAKQQIVTTITGVGASGQPDANKKVETTTARLQQVIEEVTVVAEKVVEAPKPAPPVVQPKASAFSWAGLFTTEGATTPRNNHHAPALPSVSTSSSQNQSTETQKATPAKNPDSLSIQPSPQVPGIMSYSAVSAQSVPASKTTNYAASVTTIPSQLAAGSISVSKTLPQSKMNLPNNVNIENHTKTAPVDQHAMKLGGMSQYFPHCNFY